MGAFGVLGPGAFAGPRSLPIRHAAPHAAHTPGQHWPHHRPHPPPALAAAANAVDLTTARFDVDSQNRHY